MEISCTPLRVLILDDRADDVALLVHTLHRSGCSLDWQCVATEADYLVALNSSPEMILAKGSLSQLTASRAIQLLREKKLDIPFFIMMDSDSEEAVTECLKRGATDCFLKEQLSRLGLTVRRMLDEKRMREETRQATETLQLSGADFRSAFDYSMIGMALISQDGRWLHVNKALSEMIGYPTSELLSLTIQAILHPEDVSMTLAAIDALTSGQLASCLLETRYLHKSGVACWASTNLSTVRNTQGDPLYLMVQVQEIGARQPAEKTLPQTMDARTELLNRRLFLDRLQRVRQRMKRGEAAQFAVLSLDLDHFQLIDNSFGRMSGDQLLLTLATRLETLVGSGGVVAHVGEDEFAILLEDYVAADDVLHFAEQASREIAGPFSVNGHEIFPTASIGIAFCMNEHQQAEEVLRNATIAMQCAKTQGRARPAVYTPEMHTSMVNRLQLETDLRWALKRQEFRLHYQPFFSLATGQLRGFEALLRWQHPARGLLSPGEFLSVAEATGLILPIGWWVLEEAGRQLQDWRERFVFPPAFTVSINLASGQFAHPELLPRLDCLLQESSATDLASHLQFEITEHTLMDHLAVTADQLAHLRNRGIRIALDDFGTGYSSLSYLHRLPIDTLKIDRSFVSRLGADDKSTVVVTAMVTLAHSLGIDVVAEGVETVEQRDRLRELRCEYGQGYYFSRPLTSQAAETLLSSKPHWTLRAAA